MIRHIVLLDLPPHYDHAELAEIMQGIDNLRETIDGFVHFEHGINKDFEGMSKNFAYGFVCHFANDDTSRAYIINPEHNALGQRLVNLCRGGVKGITVVDLELAA